jgi:hypothetical protein
MGGHGGGREVEAVHLLHSVENVVRSDVSAGPASGHANDSVELYAPRQKLFLET